MWLPGRIGAAEGAAEAVPKALGNGLGPPEKPPKGSCCWLWEPAAGGGKAEKPGPLLEGPKGSSKLAGPGEKLVEGGARLCSWGGCLPDCALEEIPSPAKESKPPSIPAAMFPFHKDFDSTFLPFSRPSSKQTRSRGKSHSIKNDCISLSSFTVCRPGSGWPELLREPHHKVFLAK